MCQLGMYVAEQDRLHLGSLASRGVTAAFGELPAPAATDVRSPLSNRAAVRGVRVAGIERSW